MLPPVLVYPKPGNGPPPPDTKSKEEREADPEKAKQDLKKYQDKLKASLLPSKK